jgi:hypothetical protein
VQAMTREKPLPSVGVIGTGPSDLIACKTLGEHGVGIERSSCVFAISYCALAWTGDQNGGQR